MTGMYRDQVIPPMEDVEVPEGDAPPSLIRDYLGTEPRKLFYSAGFIVGVMVVVTVPYVMLVGFDKWTNDMKEAGHMMWAAYTPPAGTAAPYASPYGYAGVTAAPMGQAYASPYGYAVVPAAAVAPIAPASPALAAPMAPYGAAPAPNRALPGLGRQYVCPSCGAVGLPSWTQSGQPLCPNCGGIMSVAALRWEAELAAAP
jgi:hypothetical protein